MAQILDQTYEQVPLDKLSQHPDNPRRGDVDAIESSVEVNGWFGAVLAQRSTGHVLAGNHRLLAAQRAGLAQLPVLWVDVDDDRARRILLADNRTGDVAAYRTADLVALLDELALTPEVLAGTGYTFATLDDLRAALGDEALLPPQPTHADYAETPEQEEARAAGRATQPGIHEAGLREVILVYPAADHAALLERVAALRAACAPAEPTTAALVLAALRAVDAPALARHL